MRTHRRLSTFISCATSAALVALVTACGSSATGPSSSAGTSPVAAANSTAATAYPVTITTAGGKTTISRRPKAIVSLSATATEMLYAIGAGSQVKAVDQFSDYPPQAPKTKLSGLQLNIESLIAEKPDLVIIDADRNGLGKRLAGLSIPLLVLPAAAQLDDVYAEMNQLGRATGHEAEAAKENAAVKTQVDKIVAAVPADKRHGTYYYELEPDYYSVTSDTFVGHLFGLIGLTSIADKAPDAKSTGGYPQLSAEYIIKANPDWIFLADTLCCKATPNSVDKRPGWSSITAVSKSQIVPLNDDVASRWGPRIVELLQKVANAMKGSSS